MSKKEAKSNPIVAFFVGAFEEFGKITWPTKEQAVMLTGVVVAVSIIMAAFIAALDLGLSELYSLITF
ncbi:preprotein translocase subunit SecE [Patescibacteria group bacterium]|nr:preprotein translocase subunit SecE [Patescibacteria group bacterium]